jgi:phosphoglycolate phosphatase
MTTRISLPRAVIFDWDNTLVDSWPTIAKALNVTRSAFGLETLSVDQARKNASRSARDAFPAVFGAEWKRAHDMFYKKYHEIHLDYVTPMPGADELLLWLSEQKIPLFVVTNKRGDIVRLEAAKLGWTERFSALIGSTDAPRDKPARDPVDLALSRAGLKADNPEIWFVGDTQADVECARNSGCTPVLVNHDLADAARLGVALSFSGCFELRSLLYNGANENKSP